MIKMSSSDSDICDFASNFEKFINKKNKKLKTFITKKLDDSVENSDDECNSAGLKSTINSKVVSKRRTRRRKRASNESASESSLNECDDIESRNNIETKTNNFETTTAINIEDTKNNAESIGNNVESIGNNVESIVNNVESVENNVEVPENNVEATANVTPTNTLKSTNIESSICVSLTKNGESSTKVEFSDLPSTSAAKLQPTSSVSLRKNRESSTKISQPIHIEEIELSDLPSTSTTKLQPTSSLKSESVVNGSGDSMFNETASKLNMLYQALVQFESDLKTKKKPKPKRGKKRRTPVRPAPKPQIVVPLLPQIVSTVTLSSDEESQKPTSTNIAQSTTKELNPIVMLTVDWMGMKKSKFKVKKFQNLDVIFDYYLNQTKVDPKLLFFTIDDREINLRESSSVSLKYTDQIIEGGLLPEMCLNREIRSEKIQKTSNNIELKARFSAKKVIELPVYLSESDTMALVMWQILEEFQEDIENLKLYFDGELVKPEDTIESLDLEDGDCLDIIFNIT